MRSRVLTIKNAALYALLILPFYGCGREEKAPGGDDRRYISMDSVPVLIAGIQRCSRVYTAEYRVHKIVTHDDEVRLSGSILNQDFNIPLPLGERKVAIPLDAKLKAYIDFSDFSAKNVASEDDRITIFLPPPKVILTSSKIDQRSIKSYIGWARPHFSDAELSSYQQQGRESIIRSIPRLGIFETARKNAAGLLIPMIERLGYKEENITVTFSKHFGEGDLRTIIEERLQ